MNKFFNMDSPFFRFMEKVADLMILNILFMVGCIPIITIGTSISATYYVTLKMARGEEPYIVKNFWKAYKSNLKQSILIHIIMVVLAYLLYLDYSLAYNPNTTFGTGTRIVLIVLSIVYIMVGLYIYPFVAQFYNSIPRIIQNCMFMSIRHITQTLMMFLITMIPVWSFFILGLRYFYLMLMALFIFGFAGIMFVNSLVLAKIFDKYIPEKEDDYEAAGERCFEDEEHVSKDDELLVGEDKKVAEN